MSQLSIPLNPVASPTNQFTAPRINPPSMQKASDLGQLAGALAKITPEVTEVLSRRQNAINQGSQARANKDFMQRRYDNMEALNKEVKAGNIPEADNPWYMVQLKQDVAANDANKAIEQAQVDWETSPVRFSDDPKEVETWARHTLSPVTDGLDATVSEAVVPVVERGVAGIVNQHAAVRRQEREEERVVNFTSRVASLMSSTDQAGATQELQSLIANARMTMPGAKVNQMVIAAAAESAQATGDEGPLALLSKIPNTGAGGTLADSPDIKKLQAELPLIRFRREMEIQRAIEQQKEMELKQRHKAIEDLALQKSEGRFEDTLFTPEDAIRLKLDPEFLREHNSQVLDYRKKLLEMPEVEQTLKDKSRKREAEKVQMETAAKLMAGAIQIDDPETKSAGIAIAARDPGALNEWNRMLQDLHTQKGWDERTFAREDDPEILASAWERARNRTLTTKDVIPLAHNLTQGSFQSLVHEVTQGDKDPKLGDYITPNIDDMLENMVVAGALKNFPSYDEARKDPNVMAKVYKAKNELAKEARSLFSNPDFRMKTPAERSQAIEDLIEPIAKKNGGATLAEREQQQQKEQQDRQAAEVEANTKMLGSDTASRGESGKTVGGQDFNIPLALTPQVHGQLRAVAKALEAKQPSEYRTVDTMYEQPNLGSTVWWGPWFKGLFSGQKGFASRDDKVLATFIHNAHLLNGGDFNIIPVQRVNSRGDIETETRRDVQTAAKLQYSMQRNELAGIRRRIGQEWVTPENKDELTKLTAKLSGVLATNGTPDPYDSKRFKELSDAFRKYDFLSVTAGITPDDYLKDYKLLYQYPAASSVSELYANARNIVSVVPSSEIRKVLEIQIGLIDNARTAITGKQYAP